MAEMAEMLQSLTGVLQGLTVQQTPQTPKVKLQKFKGPPRVPGEPSLKEWLEEAESYCLCYKLSGKSKAQALVDHLGGIAKEEVLCRAETIRENYDEVVKVLKSQFSPVESLQSLSAEFHSSKQYDNESLADFSRRLMRLYGRMEQNTGSEGEMKALQALRESSLKEAFVRGARESWVRRELRRIEMSLKKASFLEMRSEVLEFFRDQEVENRRKGREVRVDVVDVSYEHSFCPEVSVVSSNSNSNSSNEIDEIKNSLSNLSKQVAILTDSLAQMRVPSRLNEVICYNCGQKGHTKPKCTEPSLCYGCKGRGHLKKDCPVLITVESPATRICTVSDSVDTELARRLISPSPRGTIQIAGIQVGCLYDTGAETSVIPSSIFHTLLWQKRNK